MEVKQKHAAHPPDGSFSESSFCECIDHFIIAICTTTYGKFKYGLFTYERRGGGRVGHDAGDDEGVHGVGHEDGQTHRHPLPTVRGQEQAQLKA